MSEETERQNIRWTARVGIAGVIATLLVAVLGSVASVWIAKESNKTALETADKQNTNAVTLAQLTFNQREYDKYRDRRRDAYATFLETANTYALADNPDNKLTGILLADRDAVRIIGISTVRHRADDLTKVVIAGKGTGDPAYEKAREAFLAAAAAEIEAYSKEKP